MKLHAKRAPSTGGKGVDRRELDAAITLSIICETWPTFGQGDQTSSAEQKSNNEFPGRCKKQIF
jgi:hypothetical protein